MESGGSLLVMMGEGGESRFETNINFLLEEYGVYVNNGKGNFQSIGPLSPEGTSLPNFITMSVNQKRKKYLDEQCKELPHHIFGATNGENASPFWFSQRLTLKPRNKL